MATAPFTHETFAELGIKFPPEQEAQVLKEMNEALERNISVYGRKFKDDNPAEIAQDTYDLLLGDLLHGVYYFTHWDVKKSVKHWKRNGKPDTPGRQ